MVYLSLFRINSIQQGLASTKTVFGLKKNPIINASRKKLLKETFLEAGIPFIYNKSSIIDDSALNGGVLTKRLYRKEEKNIFKIAKIRAGIAIALEKTEKHREDVVQKKPYKGVHKLLLESHQYLAGKSVSMITSVVDNDDNNSSKRGGSPVKKSDVELPTQMSKNESKIFTKIGTKADDKYKTMKTDRNTQIKSKIENIENEENVEKTKTLKKDIKISKKMLREMKKENLKDSLDESLKMSDKH